MAEVCAAGASSYSIDFTCAIGTVCIVLSSAVTVISVGEAVVTLPARVVPSRIRTVACGPETGLFVHDASKSKTPRVAPEKMVLRFDAHIHALKALNTS